MKKSIKLEDYFKHLLEVKGVGDDDQDVVNLAEVEYTATDFINETITNDGFELEELGPEGFNNLYDVDVELMKLGMMQDIPKMLRFLQERMEEDRNTLDNNGVLSNVPFSMN